MNETIKVSYHNKQYEYPKDISLFEMSKSFQAEYKYDIIVAKVNNDILPLSYKLATDCNVDFYDLSSFVGNRVYEKTAILILVKAAKDVLNKDIKVEHSIDRGVYCTIDGLTRDQVKLLETKMKEIVQLKLPIDKLTANRMEMMQYYSRTKMHDKEELLKYISNTYITIYKLDNVYDYMFGEMAINTSYIKEFNLEYVTSNGCVLMLPLVCDDSKLTCYTHHEKLFNSIIDYLNWSHKIGINTVADFNKMLSEGKWNELIFICEAIYNKSLLDVAHTIAGNSSIKLILISGPSCSGKTTTSKKLKAFLEAEGLKPSVLSLDDYFKEREDTPTDENGEKDYESINAVDIDLFNNQLKSLLSYEEVLLPTYNFITGKKEYKNKLKIPRNGIIIIEGLHSLNDSLTSSIGNNRKYKIYISPLTCLNLDNHNRLSTSDNRLIRRMVRDNLRRGYNASETLDIWKSVRMGETKYVFPYQDKADIVLNTSLMYEISVLKVYAEPLLFSVRENDKHYTEAIRLINMLRMILPMPGVSVPLDSILREFIGNSCFE